MTYLRSIKKRPGTCMEAYPLCVSAIRDMEEMSFTSGVTIFCGDNGSGKSTLLEIIADKCAAYRIGGGESSAVAAIKSASKYFSAVFNKKPENKFIFTAEAFTRYIDFLVESKRDAASELNSLNGKFGSDFARALAAQPYAGTIHEIDSMYEHDLSCRSHGQGFIDFFASRVSRRGLYLLDEPEAALSYTNQLALMYIISDSVAEYGSQFIYCTHSPILLAYKGADIYEFSDGAMQKTEYDSLSSILFLKRFLAQRDDFLGK